MRCKYASRDMEGMFLAWNAIGELGVERAARDAEVRVDHMGGCSTDDDGYCTGWPSARDCNIPGEAKASFADAI